MSEHNSIPMWGSTSGWDQGAFAVYKWDFSSRFSDADCHFSVYVPDNANPAYVGGDPAYYHYWTSDYFNSKDTSGFEQFTVNQVGDLGSWVESGSFQVSGGHVDLIVVNTGVDDKGQRIAAAPIALSCTQS